MADPDLTRRLRNQLLKYDTLAGGPPAKGFILLADVRAAADRIDQLEQQLADLHTAIGDPEALARRFHEAYERLAPQFSYQTRPESAVPWDDVPEQNKALMVAAVAAAVEHTQEGTDG